MNELQSTILNLIKEIDSICRKYHITYYVSGGTVIGAFRHGGFIPWDDDADIYMTRDNFHKFIDAFNKESPKGRTLGSLEINPNYPGTLAHYRNNENTSFITRYHILNSCDAGVLVDIFILDPIDDDINHWNEHIGKLRIYADLNFPFYAYTNCGDTEYLSLYSKYEKKLKREGKYKVNKELEDDLFTYPEEKATHYILRWGTLPHVFPKEMFGEPVYVNYEGYPLPMPTKWYDYLVKLYGYNWNEVPANPADEGHVAIISTKYRYTNYLIDSDRFINKKKALKMYFKRKSLLIKRESLRRPFIETFLQAKKDYILKCQDDYLNENSIDIYDLYQNKKYNEVIKSFDIYMNYQFEDAFIGKMTHNLYNRFKNPIFIPLPDNELVILMYSLLYTADFNRLNKLLKLRLQLSYDERFSNIQNILSKVHCIMEAFYEKDYNRVYDLIQKKSDYNIQSIERIAYMFYYSKLHCNEMLSNEEIELLKNKASNDEKGYWKQVYGDYLYSINDKNYIAEYKDCLAITNDGFIINELKHSQGLVIDYKKHFKQKKKITNSQFQSISLQLLKEITQIMEQHNIPYYLIGDTLKYAYFEGTLPHKDSSLEIAIKPEYAKLLMNILKDNEKFITPLDNENILIHGFTYKSLEHHYLIITSNGKVVKQDIYIKIHILRKNSANVFKRKIMNFLNLVYKIEQENQIKSIYYFVSKVIVKVIGKKRLRSIIFNNYLKISLNNQGQYYQINRKKYDNSFFEGNDLLEFDNTTFQIPLNIDELFSFKQKESVLKASPFNKHFFSIHLESRNSIYEEQFEKSMTKNKKVINDYHKALKMNFKLRPYHRKAEYNWNILLRAEDRFNLYLQYRNKKDLIISLYNHKEYEKLWEILADYDLLARRYLLKKLGICFDKDIFNIYLKMLCQNNEEKKAKRLRKLVPKEHLHDIIILTDKDEK